MNKWWTLNQWLRDWLAYSGFFLSPFHFVMARRTHPEMYFENKNYWSSLLPMSHIFVFWSCDIHTTSNLLVFLSLSTEWLDRTVWGTQPAPVKCRPMFPFSFHNPTPPPLHSCPQNVTQPCKSINSQLGSEGALIQSVS